MLLLLKVTNPPRFTLEGANQYNCVKRKKSRSDVSLALPSFHISFPVQTICETAFLWVVAVSQPLEQGWHGREVGWSVRLYCQVRQRCVYTEGCGWRSCSPHCIHLWFSFSSQACLELGKLSSDLMQAVALLCPMLPATAPLWVSCRSKCAESGSPVLAVTSVVPGRKRAASHDSPQLAWLFTFSSPKTSTSWWALSWGGPRCFPPSHL